jgi:hypothetical protein
MLGVSICSAHALYFFYLLPLDALLSALPLTLLAPLFHFIVSSTHTPTVRYFFFPRTDPFGRGSSFVLSLCLSLSLTHTLSLSLSLALALSLSLSHHNSAGTALM